MHTDRGFERLLFFSDAVVAIAMTLLVLPLADIPAQAKNGQSIAHILHAHTFELLSFVLSFVVIGVLWRAHHSLFEHLRSYGGWILQINELWLFTIVVLPFTTELVNRGHHSRLADGLYVGTLVINSTCLSAIAINARRHPEFLDPEGPADSEFQIEAPQFITSALMTIALIIAVADPNIGLWSMLLLLLAGPIRHFLDRRQHAAATV